MTTASRYRKIRSRRATRLGAYSASITYTDTEPYALCHYVRVLTQDKSNHTIMNENDEAIKCFLESTIQLKKEDRLRAVLQKEIRSLEKQKRLTPFQKEISDETIFDDFDIPYKYEEDKRVERYARYYDSIPGDITVDIYRVLYANEKPIFSSLVNTVIFKNTQSYTLSDSYIYTKSQLDAICDITKTKFLVDKKILTKEEALYILMRCRLDSINDLRSLYRSMTSASRDITAKTAQMVNMNERELSRLLRSDKNLKTYDFILTDGDYNSALNECIENQSIEPYFSDVLKPFDCGNAYDLDSFSVSQDSTELCLDLLNGKNPVSILFYGKPGSGKTELAKSLCRQIGKQIFIFKNEAEGDNKRVDVLGKLACLLTMEQKDSIFIVDEADSLLRTMDASFFGLVPSKNKGAVNKMLENSKAKAIYIINHQKLIDESTRRRFTFSVKFESMSVSMLRSIARSKLEPLKLADKTKDDLLDMLDKRRLTGASVENLVKAIEGMAGKSDAEILKKAGIVVKENSLLLDGKQKMRQKVTAQYDPAVLNASMDPQKIVGMVQNAAKFAEKHKDTENGVRMLFYGLSGTGKTELARYISETLGKPLLLKRASDILGCYVGENEENIRAAFEEAERTDSILLFDEADTFFSDRNKAVRNWERSMVNEFLTQMEEFSGILICTTNLRKIMDPAMQRRFHILVEFKPMKFDGIKKMTDKYFPDFHLSRKEIEELEDMESVTPGDFGALASRIRFMNPDDVDSAYILEELKKMQAEKKQHWEEEESGVKRKIGFGA